MPDLTRIRQLIKRVSGPLTSLGRTVVCVGIVAWIGGVLSGWNELTVVAAACAVSLAIAALFTFGRTELSVVTILNPPRVLAGEKAVAEFTVSNAAPRRNLPVRLELPVGKSYAAMDVPSLAAGETFEEVVVIPTARRSVIAVGPTRSVRGDPIGLMRREVQWTDEQELFVHPRTTRLLGVSSGWLRDLEGRPTNERSPSDLAFHTLREYVPGDDRRHIHWRTSARVNKFMVREFIDNRRSHLAIVIDTNPASYADADEFELAVSMAASLGLRAIHDGEETTCVAGGRRLSSHTGQALLDGLSRTEMGVPTLPLPELAVRVSPMVIAASVIALATGSAAAMADVQLAIRRFGTDAQTLCVRASATDDPGFLRSSRLMVLTTDSLDTFARAMWTTSTS